MSPVSPGQIKAAMLTTTKQVRCKSVAARTQRHKPNLRYGAISLMTKIVMLTIAITMATTITITIHQSSPSPSVLLLMTRMTRMTTAATTILSYALSLYLVYIWCDPYAPTPLSRFCTHCITGLTSAHPLLQCRCCLHLCHEHNK